MLNYMLKPAKHESFYKKYMGKKYLNVHLTNYLCLLVTHDLVL